MPGLDVICAPHVTWRARVDELDTSVERHRALSVAQVGSEVEILPREKTLLPNSVELNSVEPRIDSVHAVGLAHGTRDLELRVRKPLNEVARPKRGHRDPSSRSRVTRARSLSASGVRTAG